MAFREVTVVQVREVLRRWLRNEGERRIANGAGVDRKTVRRYIAAAIEAGLQRFGDESQLSDELIGAVCEAVRPSRPDGHGESWRVLLAEEQQIKDWVTADLSLVKIHELLTRRGVKVEEVARLRRLVAMLPAQSPGVGGGRLDDKATVGARRRGVRERD